MGGVAFGVSASAALRGEPVSGLRWSPNRGAGGDLPLPRPLFADLERIGPLTLAWGRTGCRRASLSWSGGSARHARRSTTPTPSPSASTGSWARAAASATTGRAIERCCTTPTDRTPSRSSAPARPGRPTGRRSASTAPASRCTGAGLASGRRQGAAAGDLGRGGGRCFGLGPGAPRVQRPDVRVGHARHRGRAGWPSTALPVPACAVFQEVARLRARHLGLGDRRGPQPVPPLGQRAADPRQRP